MYFPIRRSLSVAVAALTLSFATTSFSQTVTTVVTGFEARPLLETDLVAGTWYDWFATGTGAASVVSLTGLGGNLEMGQPLPTGAALLTTELDNADRANVGLLDVLGTPGEVFSSLEFDYWFHKASNPGQNLNAAAALKLEIYNDTCDDPASGGDCYGVLVYEPYQNGFGNNPPVDTWMQASITPTSGTFWWTGGFGQPNGGGGCPPSGCKTLPDWAAVMSSDFDDALIVTVQIGVGSWNKGQRAYFDDLQIRHSFGAGMDVRYDFQFQSPVVIDVRPGSDRNQINTNSRQLVPIAILGSIDFDPITAIDPDSIDARGASPIGTKSDTDDVNGDGIDDLTLYFRARSFAKPTQAECEDPAAELSLSGVTFTSEPFAGADFVDWQGPDCNF